MITCSSNSNLKSCPVRAFLDLFAGLDKDASKATEWKNYRVTKQTHNPVDDARGNAEALKKFRELGFKI